MHKINLFTGGKQRSVNDFDYLQKQAVDIATALGLSYSDDPTTNTHFVLSGVEFSVSGSIVNWTEGWLFTGDEVCHVAAGGADGDDFIAGVYARIVETAHADNPVSHGDGNSHDVHVNRTIYLFTLNTISSNLPVGTVQAGDFAFDGVNLKRAEELYMNKLSAASVTNEETIAISHSRFTGNLYLVKNLLTNMVHMRGTLTVNGATSLTEPAIVLQVASSLGASGAYTPARRHSFNCLLRYHAGYVAPFNNAMGLLKNIYAEVDASGSFNIAPIKTASATSYNIEISTSYYLG
ncbi:MAG: hypothetical protein R2800_09800 [Flavipsychrobacter sp.]